MGGNPRPVPELEAALVFFPRNGPRDPLAAGESQEPQFRRPLAGSDLQGERPIGTGGAKTRISFTFF